MVNYQEKISSEEIDIVIVAYDTTVSHFCHFLLNVSFEGFFRFFPIENCSITRFQFGRSGYDNKACLNYFNDIRHLQLCMKE